MAKNVLPKHWNGSEFEELHIVTKASNVLTNDNKSVQQKIDDFTSHLADYTLQVPYAEATGTANTYSTTLNPAPTSLVNGLALAVKIPVDSTSASTINVNSLGAKGIKKANGADVTNLKAGGIYTLRYDGVNFILQGEGASGNATASDLLSGKTATTDAGEITGTMPNRGAVSQSLVINGTYTIPAGYHNGSGKVTQSITTKGAQTYTPTTTNQTIAAGRYLSGAQTILGDADLIPANILSGKNIFGVAGSLNGLTPGAWIVASNDTETNSQSSSAWVLIKEITVVKSGNYRVFFDLKAFNALYPVRAKIYLNGSPVGTERYSSSTTYVTYTEDVAIPANGKIQIYAKGDNIGGYYGSAYVINFRLGLDLTFTNSLI